MKAQQRHWPSELEDEELYKRVFRALVAVGASADEAGDALQEAYERVLRKDERIDRLDGWLFIVAQRRWRRGRLRRRLFSRLGTASNRSVGAAEPAVVLPEVRKLPDRQRQVFVARHVLGLSNAETAHALGMAEGTVSATNHQALRALRQRLGGDV